MLDLWLLPTADVGAHHHGACESVLDPQELATMRARVFEQHRHEYRVTRALCRAVLARYVDLAPAELRFRRNAYGRPALDPPGRIAFNLTNTVELVAIAVTDEGELGLDAEPLARADQILALAETVFTSFERRELSQLAPALQRTRAVQLWTLKEAYMKARGMGFAIPVQSFEIDFAGEPVLRFLPPLDDRPSAWRLEIHVAHGHVLSLCRPAVRRPAEVSRHLPDVSELLSP